MAAAYVVQDKVSPVGLKESEKQHIKFSGYVLLLTGAYI